MTSNLIPFFFFFPWSFFFFFFHLRAHSQHVDYSGAYNYDDCDCNYRVDYFVTLQNSQQWNKILFGITAVPLGSVYVAE